MRTWYTIVLYSLPSFSFSFFRSLACSRSFLARFSQNLLLLSCLFCALPCCFLLSLIWLSIGWLVLEGRSHPNSVPCTAYLHRYRAVDNPIQIHSSFIIPHSSFIIHHSNSHLYLRGWAYHRGTLTRFLRLPYAFAFNQVIE